MSVEQIKTTIYFIRHGEVNNPKQIIYGRTVDVPLSAKGFAQMKNLAKYLKNQGIVPEAIYTSPLTRTRKSAEEILKFFPTSQLIFRDELLDTDELVLAEKTLDWLIANSLDEYSIPGVEKPESIEKRMMTVINEIVAKHPNKTVFIVSSQDPIAFAIWRLINPKDSLPSLAVLAKESYLLKKGEAWQISLTSDLKVVGNNWQKLNPCD